MLNGQQNGVRFILLSKMFVFQNRISFLVAVQKNLRILIMQKKVLTENEIIYITSVISTKVRVVFGNNGPKNEKMQVPLVANFIKN
jgi:hypothetical protein